MAMMSNLKDRKPTQVGSRSFFQINLYLSFLILFAVATLFWYATAIVVSLNPEGEREPIAFDSKVGDVWNIRFTHSVEKTPWEEFFTVNGVNDLTMTHTRFESLGWGYPYSPSDGKFRQTGDNRFELVMNRPYKQVDLRVAEQAMPCIVHYNDVYDLCALFDHGTLVQVKAEYRWQFWQRKYGL
ncbi:MAG: DUF1850 domain-containing protein [Phascolarctobacterium sp.]|nr:DUF1850 domain-containing protein [Phascolarctobacterium sp.]